MGRRKKFTERFLATVTAGTTAAIDAALQPAEDRTDFLRLAIERELKRRGAWPTKPPADEKPQQDD